MPRSFTGLAKRVARKAARIGPFGRALAGAAHAAGMTALSRRVSAVADYVPQKVEFEVADLSGRPRQGWMRSAAAGGGATVDTVAKEVWLAGLDAYERPLPAVYAAAVLLTKGAVLEVGANSGLYAIMAALLDDAARVHAFEPYPPVLRSLEANLRLNGLDGAGGVTVVPKACGEAPGEATLYLPAHEFEFGDVLETSASLRADFKRGHSGTTVVPVTTLDGYVADAGLNEVGLIKADVEGFEAAVLRGAARTLEAARPLGFIELLRWRPELAALEDVRSRAGYRAVWMEPDRLVERPAVEVCLRGDNQLLYPEERRDLFLKVAEAAKLRVEAHL